ncbi:hypothetical protein CHU98_g4799 [Xylaria longipes]|nr:hypothetical protein CHU98_g4799 [Xylaria longipes]
MPELARAWPRYYGWYDGDPGIMMCIMSVCLYAKPSRVANLIQHRLPKFIPGAVKRKSVGVGDDARASPIQRHADVSETTTTSQASRVSTIGERIESKVESSRQPEPAVEAQTEGSIWEAVLSIAPRSLRIVSYRLGNPLLQHAARE